jgi:hypothetical protein
MNVVEVEGRYLKEIKLELGDIIFSKVSNDFYIIIQTHSPSKFTATSITNGYQGSFGTFNSIEQLNNEFNNIKEKYDVYKNDQWSLKIVSK